MGLIQQQLIFEEIFTAGKATGTNLDRVCATDNFVAVFDGCTPKHEALHEASAATADLVDALVACITSLESCSSWDEILSALSHDASKYSTPYGASATGVIFSRHLMEVLVVGDGWVSVDSDATFYGHKLEGILAEIRKAFTLQELVHGSSEKELRETDPGRQAILPLLAREKEFRNIKGAGEYSFAGIDGNKIPRELTVLLKVPATTNHITIASDGYPMIFPSLAQTEEFLFTDVAADPLRIGENPGTKAVPIGGVTYDDRSYVSFSLHHA